MNWYFIAFVAIILVVLVGYLIYTSVIQGPAVRPETKRAVRTNPQDPATSQAVGAESTYTPGQRVSTAQPLPLQGKEEREPTSSFDDYTEDETSSNEE